MSEPPAPIDDRRRPLLIVSLEGLATTALGCYGSSWSQTPSIDRVAARGAVWDRLIASETDPLEVLRTWFALRVRESWQHRCREIGSLELITDDRAVADPSFSEAFDRVVLVDDGDAEPREASTGSAADREAKPAETPEETGFARVIAAATERAADPECTWGAIWLHSQFLTRCWDAPRDLVLHDEWDDDGGDPHEADADRNDAASAASTPDRVSPVFSQTAPPQVRLDPDGHPDVATSWMRTYACQVRLADLLIGILRASLADVDPVLVVTGTSGFGLGENGWIGHACGPLRSGQIRLPLIVGHDTPIRSLRVTPANDLPKILAASSDRSRPIIPVETWAEADDEFVPSVVTRDADDEAGSGATAVSDATARIGVTTSRWFLSGGPEGDSLFFKPDDVNDVNDVGRLEPEVVERMKQIAFAEFGDDPKKTSP